MAKRNETREIGGVTIIVKSEADSTFWRTGEAMHVVNGVSPLDLHTFTFTAFASRPAEVLVQEFPGGHTHWAKE